MYHADRPDIIEGSDILALLNTEVQRIKGRVFATIQVELQAGKDFLEGDAKRLLHVTNGVNPRLLIPTGENIVALMEQVEADLKAVEQQQEDTIKHVKEELGKIVAEKKGK